MERKQTTTCLKQNILNKCGLKQTITKRITPQNRE